MIVYDPSSNFGVDNQQLYNSLDGLGNMIIGTVNDGLESYDAANSNAFDTNMALHEVSHFLLEGSLSLFNAKAISASSKDQLTVVG